MKQFSICLSPGHTAKNPGASRGNVTEYGLSSAIIGDLIFRLDKAGHVAHVIGSDSNRNQVERINEIDPDFGLELHFNSSVKRHGFYGTMILYSGSRKGRKLAIKLSKSISASLETKNVGPIIGNYQLDRRKPIIIMIRKTKCPFVVVEPLFLSYHADFEKIDVPLISIAIMEGIYNYWEAL